MLNRYFPSLLLAAAMAVQCAATAAPLPAPDGPLKYTVVDQDLKDLLGEVGLKIGVRTSVSDAVHGRVRGRLPAAGPREFLDRLARIYAFDWYFDGATLWVSAASENQSRIINLGTADLPQLEQALDELRFSDRRFPLRGSADAGVVIASGPPRYVQLVEQTLAALLQRARPAQDVRIFRGQVAAQ